MEWIIPPVMFASGILVGWISRNWHAAWLKERRANLRATNEPTPPVMFRAIRPRTGLPGRPGPSGRPTSTKTGKSIVPPEGPAAATPSYAADSRTFLITDCECHTCDVCTYVREHNRRLSWRIARGKMNVLAAGA